MYMNIVLNYFELILTFVDVINVKTTFNPVVILRKSYLMET